MMSGNLLVVQSGGPTPVLNATLASIVEEYSRSGARGRVLGARRGLQGLIKRDIVDLSDWSGGDLARIRRTPGACLGSSRAKPSEKDMEALLGNLRHLDVRQILLLGGNGTMRGAELICRSCHGTHYEVQVVGIPKTIDNDIAVTDRCPGYASAARYVAQSTRDLGMDISSLPQPVSIFETMGRSAGWLAGASAAAKLGEDEAPHLVYLPERPFSIERFLGDLDRVVTKLGWSVVVVAEGLRDENGNFLFESSNPSQTDALKRPLPGGVGHFLAETVASRLKIRCRTERPGLLGRCSMLHTSSIDMEDAELAGRSGVRALLEGDTNVMVTLHPLGAPVRTALAPLGAVAGKDRPVPEAWLCDSPIQVNHGFLDYIRPLIGDLLEYWPPFKASLKNDGAA